MGAGASASGNSSQTSPKEQKPPSGHGKDSFDVGPVDLSNGSDGGGNKSSSERKPVTFKVTLSECSVGSHQGIDIPEEFFIRLSYESLDLLNSGTLVPIVQFPYQSIICWGSGNKIFQFNAFPTTLNSNKSKETIKIVVNTPQGKDIDVMTMAKIRSLMADMESTAVSKEEFLTLTRLIMISQYDLVEDWYKIVDQFSSTGRMFLAKQGMELMQLVAPLAPFEKHDLAILLYNRILNKDSYQLIINVFPDKVDRDNLIHRLGLKPGEHKYTSDCDMLRSPKVSPVPGAASKFPVTVPIKPLNEISAGLSASEKEQMEAHNPSSRMFTTAHLSKDNVGTPSDGRSLNFGQSLNRSTDGYDVSEAAGYDIHLPNEKQREGGLTKES